jgi:serine/threonine-protein kinase
MGTVHLARLDGPGSFRKWLAIKVCHPSRNEESNIATMFLDEARIAARVSHPNVVSVFDCGVESGVHYMAMEYLHGEPLREVVRHVEACGVPVPVHVACRMIADAAEGLHAAHEAKNDRGEDLNIVHRDVSPHNLFVTYDGTVKLVDFGVAKYRAKSTETRVGTIKGKVAYMSPEQARGDTVDRRADVFALGIILWELTTARRLFRGDDILDTIAKVLEQDVPRPSRLVRGYPADLEAVVMKALAKRREDRFQTAHDLARALMEVLIRRGLFVTNDEVLLYMQAAFGEQIQERDAILRTAALMSFGPLPAPVPPPRKESPTMDVQSSEIERDPDEIPSIDVVLDENDLEPASLGDQLASQAIQLVRPARASARPPAERPTLPAPAMTAHTPPAPMRPIERSLPPQKISAKALLVVLFVTVVVAIAVFCGTTAMLRAMN